MAQGPVPETLLGHKSEFRTHTTVSPEKIFAAGGTTTFGLQAGKNNETLKRALKNSPEPEPFTEEEWASLVEQMANDK